MMKIKKLFFLLLALTAVLSVSVCADFDGYILAFRDEAARDAAFALITDNEMPGAVSEEHLLYKTYDEALAEAFDKCGYLSFYEENTLIDCELPEPRFFAPNMAQLFAADHQWSHELCGTKLAWKLGVTGRGQTAMVIDSGVISAHEDLTGTVVGGYDYAGDTKDYAPKSVFSTTSTAYYHGTMVTGFVAANHNDIGVTGVAYDANVYMARCISDAGKIPMDKAAFAIMKAGELGISAINMSFGTTDKSSTMSLAVMLAEDDGVILCAAAGNTYGGKEIQYPASCTGAVSVAACGSGGTASGYTSNALITVTAPGVSVRSTHANGRYYTGSGTSYASPYVTGAALLAKSVDADITPAHFREVMIATADKTCLLGAPHTDTFGYGIINVGRLISALLDEKYDTLYVGPLFHDYETGADSYTVLNATDFAEDFVFRAFAKDGEGIELDEKLVRVTLEPGETEEIDVSSLCALPHESVGYEILAVPSLFLTTPMRSENGFGLLLYDETDAVSDATLITALYDENGRMTAVATNDISASDDVTPISVTGLSEGALGGAAYIRCFLLQDGCPICDAVYARLGA